MADEGNSVSLHVVVFPYHGQGHINPMLQFAKRLSSKGVHITFATTLSNSHKLRNVLIGGAFTTIAVESVYDDIDEGRLGPMKFIDSMERFNSHAAENLARLLSTAMGGGERRRVALVYDANLPWGVEVAKKHGVPAAAFFTQACATIASYYPLYLESKGEDPAAARLPPVVPPPSVIQEDLPGINLLRTSTSSGQGKINPFILMVLEQFKTLDQADWVLFNSFFKLEEQVVKWMETLWPVKTIGPTIPSSYLDKRVENDVNYGFNLFKPVDDACMSWLNTKRPGSVVYIAFGSAASLSEEQMAEVAEALKQVPCSFLWVVRETEEKKLPANFISETSSDKGLVVSWCPQLDVLAHEAVGCFVSHCGWNSTVEALSLGVPVLAMSQFLDQKIDAHLIEQLWGVGVRAKADENRFVSRDEIGRCLNEIMLGENAKKIMENTKKWKELAKEAVDVGGSSDKNIDEIIARLASL